MLLIRGQASSLAISSFLSVALLTSPSLARPQVAQAAEPLPDHLHPHNYPVEQCLYPNQFEHAWDDAKVVPGPLPDPNDPHASPDLYTDPTFATGDLGLDPDAGVLQRPSGNPNPIGPYGDEPCAQIRFHRFDDCRGFIRLRPYRLRYPDNRYNVVWFSEEEKLFSVNMWTKPRDRTWWDQERITGTAGSFKGDRAIKGAIDVMFDISCPPSGVTGELTLFWTADLRPLDTAAAEIEGEACYPEGDVLCMKP